MTLSEAFRDRVWFLWFCMQVPVILCVDTVDKYPAWLCADAGAPLHFLHRFRAWYLATYNDPLLAWTPETTATIGAGGSFMPFFLWIEVFFLLPVAVYSVARFATGRRTTGAYELLLVVYAFETALSTAVCIHNINGWSPSVYSEADKNVFRYQLMGPWFAIPALMFVDMYGRLLARFQAAEGTKKVQ